MYPTTRCSHRLQTEKAEYPPCHANSVRSENVSWIQRDELALSASTRFATERRDPSDTYKCTWSGAPPAQSKIAPLRRAIPAKHRYSASCHARSIHGWRRNVLQTRWTRTQTNE